MRRLVLAIALLGSAVCARAAYIVGPTISTTTGRATEGIAGTFYVAASSQTSSTATITLTGATGSIAALSSMTASSFFGDGSHLTGLASTVTAAGGAVLMYPTSANTVSGADAWTVIAPSGTPVNCAGTTTRCLQEAITYAANNGWPLRVRGWGSTNSGTTQPFINATTQIKVPATQQWSADIRDVNITFTNAVTTDGFVFDSSIITDFEFDGGQIVYGSSGCAVRFNPTTVLPIDGFTSISDSRYFISNIAVNGSAPLGVVCFTPTGGGINNNKFGFIEVNGGMLAKYGILVASVTATNAFQSNLISATHVHESTGANVQIGLGPTNQNVIRHNIWDISGIHPYGTSSVGLATFASSDTYRIGAINGETLNVSTGVLFYAGANFDSLTLGGVLNLAGPAINVNGNSESIAYNSTLGVGVNSIPANAIEVNGSATIGTYGGTARAANGLVISGALGVGTPGPKSAADIAGGLAIGSYGGATAAPSNSLIVSGSVGVSTALPAANLDVAGVAVFGLGATKSTITATGDLILASGSSITLAGSGGFVTSASSVTASAFFGNGGRLSNVSTSVITNNFNGDINNTALNVCASTFPFTLDMTRAVQITFSGSATSDNNSATVKSTFLIDGAFPTGLDSTNALSSGFVATAANPVNLGFDWTTQTLASGAHNACIVFADSVNVVRACRGTKPFSCQFKITFK